MNQILRKWTNIGMKVKKDLSKDSGIRFLDEIYKY